MDKSYIFLKSPIGSGGEANIYTVRIRPELVAKVYKKPHGDYARKLAFMIANPPVDPLASSGRVSIAWATELVTDLGLVVGFLMPKLDTSKAKPIFQYYNPSERRKESPTFSYVSLMRTARNLARAVRSVHSRGYVIGDVNESNVLVADDAIVTLVDTDSFQVNDGTTVYRCTVGKPEYTPPELQGMSFRDVDRSVEHDLFGLGVLIYQLLMEGTHPFGGVFSGQGEAPELKDRIKTGHFPHGRRRVPYKPMPHISFQMLPVALQELFLLCFEVGHGNPAARPTAEVWSKALGVAEDGLVTCGVNGQHHYSGHLGVCPWCERAVKLRGRDPFPALGVISSGQHLKPAEIGKSTSEKSPTEIVTSKLNPQNKPVNPAQSNLIVSPQIISNLPTKANAQSPNPSVIDFKAVLVATIPFILIACIVFIASRIRPKLDSYEEYINRGLGSSQSQNYQGAIEDYTEATNLKPNFADAYVLRAIANCRAGKRSEAISDAQKAKNLCASGESGEIAMTKICSFDYDPYRQSCSVR
jgi:DNA-binding helix-hairpin-helix protein with protein kinase domain